MADLEIIKTDTVLMEYVRMSIFELSHSFLFRFIEPIKTIWKMGSVSLFDITKTPAAIIAAGPTQKQLEDFALTEWRKDFTDETFKNLSEEERATIDLKKSRVIECEIVRKAK